MCITVNIYNVAEDLKAETLKFKKEIMHISFYLNIQVFRYSGKQKEWASYYIEVRDTVFWAYSKFMKRPNSELLWDGIRE